LTSSYLAAERSTCSDLSRERHTTGSKITCRLMRPGSPGAVVVEHRYIGPIIGGAIEDGLVVQ